MSMIESVVIDQKGKLVLTFTPQSFTPGGVILKERSDAALLELKSTPEGTTLEKQRKLLADAFAAKAAATANADQARQLIDRCLACGEFPDEGEQSLSLAHTVIASCESRIAALHSHIEQGESSINERWERIRQQVVRNFADESADRLELAKAAFEQCLLNDVMTELLDAVEQSRFSADSFNHSSYLPVAAIAVPRPAVVLPTPAEPRPFVDKIGRENHPRPPKCTICAGSGHLSFSHKGPPKITCENCSREIEVPADHEFAAVLAGVS